MMTRIVPLVLSLALLVALAACSASPGSNATPTPTANELLCTNLNSLQTSTNALMDTSGDQTMADFAAKWNQVKADLTTVKNSAQSVANANVVDLSSAFDAFTQSVQNASNAGSVVDTLAQIQTAAKQFGTDLQNLILSLKCS